MKTQSLCMEMTMQIVFQSIGLAVTVCFVCANCEGKIIAVRLSGQR